MAEQPARATLTIRIEPTLHRSLAAVADAEGVSMNAVAEAALNREVVERAADLADNYARAAETMRSLVRSRLADLIDEIAADEATTPEAASGHRVIEAPEPTFEAISARARRVG